MGCKCGVNIDFWAGDKFMDECEFSMITNVRADVKCGECGSIIKVGDEYRRAAGIYEGEPFEYNDCRACASAIDVMFEDGAFAHGGLWDAIEEYIVDCKGEIPESCISKLEPQARERVLEIIQKIIGG